MGLDWAKHPIEAMKESDEKDGTNYKNNEYWGNSGEWLSNQFDTFWNGGANQIARRNIESQEKINQANIDFQREVNQKNLDFQNRNFNYQKELNNLTMQREDNAIQRSVNDYQAAGFNRLLAISNPASTNAIQTYGGSAEQQAAKQEAYIRTNQNIATINNILNMMGKVNEISSTVTNNQLVKNQAIGQQIVNDWNSIKKLREDYEKETDKYRRELIQKQISSLEHNISIAVESGRPIGVDPKASNLWSLLDKIISSVGRNSRNNKGNGALNTMGQIFKFFGF